MDEKKIVEALETLSETIVDLKIMEDETNGVLSANVSPYETAIEALEKQLSKKVIDRSLVKDNEVVVGSVGRCPCCNEIIDDTTTEGVIAGLDEAKDINVPSNDGWIPVEKKLPEEGQKVLVWYEYFRYGEYNRMFKTYGIGWQFDGHWSGDVSGTKARCIAWQPLPERYKGGDSNA